MFSFSLGLFFEKQGFKSLKKVIRRTGWQGGDTIIKSLRGIVWLWFTIAGVSLVLTSLPIRPSFLNIIQKVLLVFFLASVNLVASRLAIGLIQFYSSKGEESPQLTTLFENLTRILIFSLGILIIIQSIGIAITPLLTALGIGGVSIGLALQSTFANLFSSVNILTAKKLRPGDYIKLKTGEEGYVQDITWKHTIIQEINENWLVVPNSKIVNSSFRNYSFPEKELLITIEVGVSYDSDLEKVETVTLEIAREVIQEVAGGVWESEPFIRYHHFDYFRINFTVYLKVQEFFDSLLIKHEFIKRLHQRYLDEGIEIPSFLPLNYSLKNTES
ncbi:MAG: mechanosensitive ion channel family protein [Xenococcaceae cyanobacterium MO_167.B52]|nr:mechanosensitive ion channel family protein [Xenococcaceae cyanobacterium MO_167.B52]